MSYVVLARKWRPTQFDEVVGQGHVARTLKNAIELDRVHHAFLFCGARGVGKTSTARILAKALNCLESDGPTTTPCGECDSCVEIASGQSTDVFEIDGASNRGINEIRELRESVRYAPGRDRYKVYIIDEVHMLTTEAFNALLKTLEEPPPHAKFIFATTEPQKIPVTILSRCQRYDFKRIGQNDIVEHLEHLAEEEEMDVERGALQVLARQAAGGMRDAVSLLDQVVSFAEGKVTEDGVVEILGVANRKHLFELSGAVLARDAEAALTVLEEVNRYGYDLSVFAGEFVAHLRDLMVVKIVSNPDRVTEMTGTEIEAARGQVDGVDKNLLHRMFTVITKAAQEMARTAFPKLVFEMALVRVSELEPLAGLDVMVSRLVELERSFDGEERLPMMPAEKKRAPIAESGTSTATSTHDAPPSHAQTSTPDDVDAPAEHEDHAEDVAEEVGEVSDGDERDEEPLESEAAGEAAPAEPPPEEAPPVQEPLEDPPPERAPPSDEPPVDDPPADPPPDEKPPAEPPKREPPRQAPPIEDPSPDEPPIEEPPSRLESTDSENGRELPPIEPLTHGQLEEMGPSERWKHVVETLRKRSSPIAAAAEHAYVERFEDGIIDLSFADKYLDFINEGARLDTLREVVHALFGEKWKVVVATRDDSAGAPTKTLAQERDEDRQRRRENLQEELLGSEVFQQVKEVFEVDEEEVRVQVALFDDPT